MNENTTKIILTVAVLGVLLYFVTRPKVAAAKMVTRPPASAGPGQVSTALKDVTAFGQMFTSLGGLFKSSSSPAVPTSTTPAVQNIPDTATSNYLADTTASADDASGVVGFGGWD